MAISAKQVQELRAKTGAGIMDCKKALNEAGGSLDGALEALPGHARDPDLPRKSSRRALCARDVGHAVTKPLSAGKQTVDLGSEHAVCCFQDSQRSQDLRLPRLPVSSRLS